MTPSVSFDRAASYYDETRALPDDLMTRLVELLSRDLAPAGRVLEIGVGTGRFAVPLRSAGVDVLGVDISAAMLARLRERDPSLPVARADGTRLPLRDASVGAAYAVHVLHLVPDWRGAVSELLRVVRPGGLFLLDTGGQDNPIERKFMEVAGAADRRHPGLGDPAEVGVEVAALGGEELQAIHVDYVHEIRLRDYVERLAAGTFSRTWSLDPATLRRAGAATLDWAQAALGDVDEVRRVERTITFHRYRFAG